MIKEKIKKLVPKSWLLFYHKTLAVLAAVLFGFPSRKLIVIGITGTKGKTTTCNLIAKILEGSGNKVGMATTANFKIGKKEWVNDKKQTMLGRFALQGLLREMVGAGCQYAIVEVSSEGITQFRHRGIDFDVAVFTNLTPEHIESHGSFANYRQAKGELFKSLAAKKKTIDGKIIPKVIVANADDEQADYFLKFTADKKITFGLQAEAEVLATNIDVSRRGVSFQVDDTGFTSLLLGKFNVYNLLGSVATCRALGLEISKMTAIIEKIPGIPGRMELINNGQKFSVIVDYTYEPRSFEEILHTLTKLYKNEDGNLIVVTGSCGGGRDKSRQPVMGKLAAQYADYVIVTNEDPYDDDPQEIIDRVAEGAEMEGKTLDKNLFKISDRREGIKKALSIAGANDVVLVAGKGSEPVIAVAGGKYVPWDDRQVTRELLKEIV